MKDIKSKIELGLNIVVTIAVVVVAAITVQRYLSPPHADHGRNSQAQTLVGTRITVPGVDGRQNQKSLVFFLKKDCPACKMAAPFYRQLIGEASKRNVEWLTILPDPLDDAKQYVRSLDIPADNVRSETLSSYRISAVPTVLFVNGDGVVKGAWVGAAQEQEKETRAEVVALLEAKGP